jgi:hypothetical protein
MQHHRQIEARGLAVVTSIAGADNSVPISSSLVAQQLSMGDGGRAALSFPMSRTAAMWRES